MTIELYRRYLSAVEATPWNGQMMPYDWGQLPMSLSVGWMAYGLMFNEFSAEIANSLNQLTGYVHRLKAWSAVISTITDQDELIHAVHEFIEPLGTVSLTLPYVIRSRFIFATAHLCHQANQSVEGIAWKDDLPLDHEILFEVATSMDVDGHHTRTAEVCLNGSVTKIIKELRTTFAMLTITVFRHVSSWGLCRS